jgi:hypothetical protein
MRQQQAKVIDLGKAAFTAASETIDAHESVGLAVERSAVHCMLLLDESIQIFMLTRPTKA